MFKIGCMIKSNNDYLLVLKGDLFSSTTNILVLTLDKKSITCYINLLNPYENIQFITDILCESI